MGTGKFQLALASLPVTRRPGTATSKFDSDSDSDSARRSFHRHGARLTPSQCRNAWALPVLWNRQNALGNCPSGSESAPPVRREDAKVYNSRRLAKFTPDHPSAACASLGESTLVSFDRIATDQRP
jgi:hypothetical protein